MNKLLFEEETYLIRGAVFEVYKNIGCGFLEAVYQECLELELWERGIPFKSQVELRLNYKGTNLQQYFRADIICFDKIIVEIKAVTQLSDIHKAQLLNYLKVTGFKLGLLVNFCSFPTATIERIVL